MILPSIPRILMSLVLFIGTSAALPQPGDPPPDRSRIVATPDPSGLTSSAYWQRADQARELFMAGKARGALEILSQLASDTLEATEDHVMARRELTAYVLYDLGEHERAFDTLYLLLHGQARSREEAVRDLDKAMEAGRIRLALERERYREDLRRAEILWAEQEKWWIIGLGSLAAVLLTILILVLFFRKRRSDTRRRKPSQHAPPLQEERPASPPIVVQTKAVADQPSTHPLRVEPVMAHATHLSSLLNRNDTLAAAVHVDALLRFLRPMAGRASKEWLPLQQAILLIRQYLKLESLRADKPLRYSVDTSRDLSMADAPVPAFPLLSMVCWIQERISGIDGSFINVELLAGPGGEETQCVIRHPLPTGDGAASLTSFPPQDELRYTVQEREHQGLKVLEWQAVWATTPGST